MKRSPLKRSPIKRRKPMQRRPPRPRKGADPERLAWVRSRPCAICGNGLFSTAHHPRQHKYGASGGRKSADRYAIPLCGSGTTGCHGSIGDPRLPGPFHGRSKAQRMAWETGAVMMYQVLYERHRAQCDASEDEGTF